MLNDLLSCFSATTSNAAANASIGAAVGASIVFTLIILTIAFGCGILYIIAFWKIFKKAGQEGWKSIIPIYNIIVLLQICDLPEWYVILCFIPLAQIYVSARMAVELAYKFGKSTGFGICSFFFGVVTYPILAFGQAQYVGHAPATTPTAAPVNPPTPTIPNNPNL